MCDEWMPTLKLSISFDEFRQLPRNAAYKYEYFNGHALLTPRPRFYHAQLDLPPLAGRSLAGQSGDVKMSPLALDDWQELVAIFSAAFDRQQPFSSLSDNDRDAAARHSLDFTRNGGDGPLLASACFTARSAQHGAAVGAILVTLLPDVDPTEWGAFHWKQPPPPDCVERRTGRPHLTWIFVSPLFTGEGVGTALLDAAVRGLLSMGFTKLATTFLAGNESSTLWHWRNGFRLMEYPGSKRKRRDPV
jgi:GNAT superfamily N-acetyltransferase